MKAIAILRHAIRQVSGNAGQVARIAALPLFLGLVLSGLIVSSLSRGLGGPGTMFALVVATSLIGAWVAVNFHRMVLLGERFDWLPVLHLREIGRYLLAMIPVVLALLAVALGAAFALSATILPRGAAGQANLGGLVVQMALGTGLGALALRLFAPLPAAAIGDPPAPRGAFRGTLPAILGLSALVVAAQVAIGLALSFAGLGVARLTGGVTPGLILGLGLAQQVATALIGLVGISLLTTLYGHYVQGRPLREE